MFAARKAFMTAAAAGPGLPAGISDNFLLWLDAADFNGTTWTAKKGTSPDKYGTVSASTYGGKPSALFGSNGYFQVSNLAGVPPKLAVFAVIYQPNGAPFIVEQSTNANSSDGFYFYSDAYFPYNVYRSSIGARLYFNPDGNTDWFTENTFGLGSINFDGTALNLQYNGNPVSSSVVSGSTSSYDSNFLGHGAVVYIGSRAGNNIFFNGGHLCELIISPGLSSSNYSTVTTFLKTKYSL